ncbi:hypothetical protein NHP164001_02040 [Helicobacter trogontum]|uniref:Uncharacterized protein n=1 Tax=Helicobacter trogontum TaxID=50960 RepID=A0ABQ0D1I1_9HELI
MCLFEHFARVSVELVYLEVAFVKTHGMPFGLSVVVKFECVTLLGVELGLVLYRALT